MGSARASNFRDNFLQLQVLSGLGFGVYLGFNLNPKLYGLGSRGSILLGVFAMLQNIWLYGFRFRLK